ncbi:MAG TPA: NADH-quinone oxidoreductase subunit M, partial [Candidatus Poseidoniales archaeon]
QQTWIKSLGIEWFAGVDGISLFLVVLTGLLFPFVVIAINPKHDHKAYYIWIQLLQTGCMGVFVSLDLFMFFVFFEIVLIPMYFLIGKWGHGNAQYAATKFFLYTMFGSALMLVSIVSLAVLHAQNSDSELTFNLLEIATNPAIATNTSRLLFLGFALAFAVKVPLFPVHTWLPDAHVQAPTAGSMLLAGVMLKMGAYGFLRIAVTALPESTIAFIPLLIFLGMVSLVYGAWVCMGQTNLKRMVAYSSVSHMGLIFLGIATMQPLGIAGALFMMFAHGIISPLLFAVAGAFKHHYHTLEIGSMRGIAHHSPWLAGHMMLGWMASLGLPLLAGFVAEVTILIAFWMTFGWLVLLPALTLIITAVYYLTSMQKTIFESDDPHHGILPESLHGEDPSDITWHENAGMLILGAFTVLFGILPFIFWDMMSDWSSGFTVETLIDAMHSQEWKP